MDRGKEEKGKRKRRFPSHYCTNQEIMPCLFYIKPFKFRGIWFGIQCGLGRRQIFNDVVVSIIAISICQCNDSFEQSIDLFMLSNSAAENK
jgi:hypothetical protein